MSMLVMNSPNKAIMKNISATLSNFSDKRSFRLMEIKERIQLIIKNKVAMAVMSSTIV